MRLTEGSDWTSRFAIAVRDEGERFVGALTVHSNQSSSEQREVSAKSCEEVLETLALIVAVAIDPNASLSRRPPRREPPNASSPPPTAPPPTPTKASRPVAPRAPVEPGRAPAWHQWLALGIEARGAFSSDAATAGSVAFELERRMPGGWGWSMRLAALRSLESRISDPFGREATFQWSAGRIDAGPLLLAANEVVSVQPGLGLDLGAIEAEAERSATRLWVSALAFLRTRWNAFSPFSLEGTVGAFTPLTRDEFVLFDPNAVVYQERALLGFVALSLSARLH